MYCVKHLSLAVSNFRIYHVLAGPEQQYKFYIFYVFADKNDNQFCKIKSGTALGISRD